MFINESINEIKIDDNLLKRYNMTDMCYFDIETTGFDKEQDSIILISMGYFLDKERFYIKQYFAEELSEEKSILKEFQKDLSKFNKWCSYNGIAFDEPFILRRMDKHLIEFCSPVNHLDLYRIIRPYYQELGLERCNLKTVEKFIGINRKDEIDGGKSVELYKRYLELKEDNIKQIILLHNYEDVLDLPCIFKLVYKIDINEELNRENRITPKQLKYLKFLLSKQGIKIEGNLERMSKKNAHKIINMILSKNIDEKYIYDILNNMY